MSRLVVRILLATLVVPLGGLAYVATVVAADELDVGRGYRWADRYTVQFVLADVVTWVGVQAYWRAIWRAFVKRTPTRTRRTVLISIGSVVAGVAVGGSAARVFDRGFPAFAGGMVAILGWLVGATLAWQETADERAGRPGPGEGETVVCPNCRYNLAGLTEARCPECGRQYLLDELFRTQPGKSGELQ